MNPKHWTYEQKNMAVLAGILLLCVIGYWAAFGKTWQLWQENRQLQAQMQLTTNIAGQIIALEKSTQHLKSYQTPNRGQEYSNHEELLEQISGFCQQNKLLVREFPPPSLFEETQYLIETNEVVVEGAFKDIVKLIYDLEQVSKTGRVASVTFEAGPDRKTRQYRLAAHIIIQNIKPRTDES